MNKKLLKQVFDKIPVIVFIGQSGCGKETQLKLMRDVYKLIYPEGKFFLSETGQLLRDEIPKMVPWARKILEHIQKAGKFQSPEIAQMVWMHEVLYNSSEGPIFIDGSPRSLAEAKVLHKILVTDFKREMILFYINVTDEEAERRILARNEIYLQQNREIREDCSTPERIKQKLASFHVKDGVLSGIKFLDEASGVSVYTINSDQKTSKQEVQSQVISILETYHSNPKK
jgi:adenylate kinase family enzyme